MTSGIYVEKEKSYLTTNDVNSGALDVSPGFNRWSMEIPGGITFPNNAKNLTLECPQASLWYSSHLITANDANLFKITTTSGGGHQFIITIPPGLWDIPALQTFIYQTLITDWDAQFPGSPADAIAVPTYFSIKGLPAIGKTIVTFGTGGLTLSPSQLQINFDDTTIGGLLGFENGDIDNSSLVATQIPVSFISDNEADFDAIGSYLFTSTLCGGSGVPVNSTMGNVVAQIVPDCPPGAQILFRPPNPTKIDVSHLRGKTINFADFVITDEKSNEVVFNGEINTFVLTFKWLEEIS